MNDDLVLIYSPLQRTFTEGDASVEIQIYRLPDTGWTLEVVDKFDNSTVWDEEFATDQEALDAVLEAIREEGIGALIGEPSAPPVDRQFEQAAAPLRMATPLSVEEIDELNDFLMSDAASDETMAFDCLDGYLTATIIGPTSLNLSQWYHGIWGSKEEDAPAFETIEQAQHIMDLVMRHYNGIVWSLKHDPDTHEPLFNAYTLEDESLEYFDGEMWAYGFMQGLELCRKDWQPLFDDPQGSEWMRPIRLLGEDDLSEEDQALTLRPEQREAITQQIPASVTAIYRYWLPYRQATYERSVAKTIQRTHPKIGRNDPCPCGSGKKFKKCCGMAALLH